MMEREGFGNCVHGGSPAFALLEPQIVFRARKNNQGLIHKICAKPAQIAGSDIPNDAAQPQ
jgi:hypothetical protein